MAPITGAARAAVAIVRLSGPEAWDIGRKLFTSLPEDAGPLRLYYGRFAHGDDGYLALFEASRSYTGEAAAECSIHGSPASVQGLIELAIEAGARFAEPGEFTQRAFLNGRIDLTQAEAVRDTIEAQTMAQLRAANRQREGALFREVSSVREELISVLAAVEATVDFSEEIGDLDRSSTADRIVSIQTRLSSLNESARAGRILRGGLRVALLGRPNAGKSSLLNALLGSERAIVTATPGTTRDFVEESIELEGFPIVLIDTAGLRESTEESEVAGIERARSIARTCDLVLYLYDLSGGYAESDRLEVFALDRPVWIVGTKLDLAPSVVTGLRVSSRDGTGLSELRRAIRQFAGEEPSVAINARHQAPITAALDEVGLAVDTLLHDRPVDLASVSLRGAISALGEVTGETADPDMISRIFHDFCIGK